MEQEQSKTKKSKKWLIVTILAILEIVLLVCAFFAGIEFKKYEIRKAIEKGMSEITSITNSGISVDVNSGISADKKASKRQDEEITVKLTKKDFFKGDWDYQDRYIFGFELTNNTDKDIRAINGNVIFNDLFGNPLQSIELQYTDPIKAKETAYYEDMWEYNPYINSNVRLKDIPFKDATYSVSIDDIVYLE